MSGSEALHAFRGRQQGLDVATGDVIGLVLAPLIIEVASGRVDSGYRATTAAMIGALARTALAVTAPA